MKQHKLVTMKLFLLLLSLFTLMSSAAKQHVDWTRTEVMDPFGLYILQWRLERKDIIFTATVNTRGFIGLGFSYRHGRMTGSDLVLAWVDDHTGLPNVLVSSVIPTLSSYLLSGLYVCKIHQPWTLDCNQTLFTLLFRTIWRFVVFITAHSVNYGYTSCWTRVK